MRLLRTGTQWSSGLTCDPGQSEHEMPPTSTESTEERVQAIFKEIEAREIDAVRQRLDKDPGTIAMVATFPLKKHAGQSLLMVACKVGQFEIMQLLLVHGPDVDFVDSASLYPYQCPVLHDAISGDGAAQLGGDGPCGLPAEKWAWDGTGSSRSRRKPRTMCCVACSSPVRTFMPATRTTIRLCTVQ